jgi:hypothetical protein
MKRNVLVIAGLAVLSTNAFASKARVEALNQDSVRGSEYISDSRNIFRNPAMLNSMSNYVITEWGVGAAADSATSPRAEGGFFREAGAFNYGLYLGNNQGQTRDAGFLSQTNAMDLFFSGDMGVQWGAKLHYAAQQDETAAAFKKKNNAFGLGLGVASGAFDAYLDLTLADKSEGETAAGDEFKTKPSFIVGGSYAMGGNTFFASYESNKSEQKIGTTTTTNKDSEISVGAGRTWDINPTAKVFTDAKIVIGTTENTFNTTSQVASNPKLKSQAMPVTIGMEAEATSWLTLRGSVTQNVILGSQEEDSNLITVAAGTAKKKTIANSTNVSAGATLNFGKLKVDGVIGTTGAARNGAAAAEEGVLATDNLLTRVGVTYMF